MLTIPAPDAVKTIRTEHLEIKQEAKSFGTYVGKRSGETGDEAGTYLTCNTFKRGTFSGFFERSLHVFSARFHFP